MRAGRFAATVALGLAALTAARAGERGADGAGATGAGSLYDRYCAACHGVAGDGAGPAAPWLWPKPRDFTRGVYKWRTTASGKPPTDEDLARTIRAGAPGTSMPAFAGILDDAQIAELVAVVKGFAPKRFATAPTPVPAAAPPANVDALAARGKELFARTCASCHGEGGQGDGPSAAKLTDDRKRAAPPFDLTREPLRRGASLADIRLTLVTGLDGTPMPSFASLPAEDLWALAAFVRSIAPATPAARSRAVAPLAWADGARWREGLFVPAQGAAPEALPPAARSLSSRQCGRCHAKQLREWKGSLHARTASPGMRAQFPGMKAEAVAACLRCHAPLAEQRPGAPDFDESLYKEGATCAGCHVRGFTRRGPPRRKDAALLEIPSYPVVEDAAYERSDFCLPCHQLAPESGVGGRPLLDTYREWLEGPYMARGVQCQHCHMPDREHTWRGAHDPETVRQAFRIDARATRDGEVRIRIENVGAGHFAPTTPTPAGYVEVRFEDGKGKPLGASTRRIGRRITWGKQGWTEHEDTRIPPGGALELGVPAIEPTRAARARVTLRWAPDDYYEGFYARWLSRKDLGDEQRKLFEEALTRARKNRFVVEELTIPLPGRR